MLGTPEKAGGNDVGVQRIYLVDLNSNLAQSRVPDLALPFLPRSREWGWGWGRGGPEERSEVEEGSNGF